MVVYTWWLDTPVSIGYGTISDVLGLKLRLQYAKIACIPIHWATSLASDDDFQGIKVMEPKKAKQTDIFS